MDTFSSLVLTVVFLSGASTGALITSVIRYGARNRILRDFEGKLTESIERTQRKHDEVATSAPSAAPNECVEDVEEAHDDDDMSWTAAHHQVPRTHGLRL